MAKTQMQRDPNSHSWKPVVSDKGSSSSSSKTTDKNKSGGGSGGGGSFELPAETTDPKSAKGKSRNKQNKKAYYTLTGSVNYVPSKKSIKIKAGDTIKMKGLGSYLSGTYYVGSVTRTVDASSGYSQSLEVYKPNFRKTLKMKGKKKTKGGTASGASADIGPPIAPITPQSVRLRGMTNMVSPLTAHALNASSADEDTTAQGVDNSASRNKVKTYTVSGRGDTPYTVALRFYGDASKWRQMYYKNNGQLVDPSNFAIGTVICLP